jgi:hypothetical protein
MPAGIAKARPAKWTAPSARVSDLEYGYAIPVDNWKR